MASAGVVTVDFDADSARFNAELRKVQTSIEGVDDRMKKLDKVASVARGAITAFVGAFAVDRLAGFATAALELGDAIDKASKRAGLSAEAFSELNFAAKLSAVSTQDLSTAFRFFQNELGKGGDKIKSLGIDLEAFRAQQPDRQFEVLAEAIASIQDPAQRTAASIQVFGDAGSKLLPLFEDGAKGIRAARMEAQMLGITLSTEQAKSLADAGDAITKLTDSYDAFATKLVGKVAKAITATAESLAKLTAGAGQTESEVISSRIAELDAEIAKRSRDTRVGRGGVIPAEDSSAAPERIGRGGIPANLSAFLEDRAALLERFGQLEREQQRIEQAAAAATNSAIDPSARTLGNDNLQKAVEEAAKITTAINSELNRNNAELEAAQAAYLERSAAMFEQTEGRKTLAAIQEAERRRQAEIEAANFSETLAFEQAQREAAIRSQATDLALGSLVAIGAANQKFAKIAKLANIAAAIRNTAEGVTKALASAPPPANFGLAAAVAAAGAVQIATIRSTPDIGDRGSSASFIGGGSIGSRLPFAQQELPQQQAPQAQPAVMQIIIQGDFLNTRESGNALVDIIREQLADDVMLIPRGSRQAQEFMPAT